MESAFIRCTAATALTVLFVSSVANAQQAADINEALFDSAPPVLEDNLPPDISHAELQEELSDSAAENITAAPIPKINPELIPFNSKRADLIEALQSHPDSVIINGHTVKLKNPARVLAFYQHEQFPTVWTHENQPTALTVQLQHAIASSIEDALNPQSYHQSIIEVLQPGTNYQDITALEIIMTDAWLSLAEHLANGLVNPQITSPEWNAKTVSDTELAGMLADGVINSDIEAPLNNLNAGDRYYQNLKAQYNAERHHTNTDRYAINMDRVRWMPQNWHQGRYILVNIPAYEVKMVQNGKDIYQSRAVVGRTDRQTPRFTDRMRHVVLAPTWTVPPTILQKDKLQRLKASPGSFDANFEVVAPGGKIVKPSSINWNTVNPRHYALRQKPGRNNALGVVKFLFPNKHAIYLHDTPSKGLFNQAYRAKSSGCVRLQKPLELANILLQNTNWTPAKIKTTANSGKQQYINPPQTTPIYLVYWTAWADTDGKIRHAKDIYKLDAKLINAYKQALVK